MTEIERCILENQSMMLAAMGYGLKLAAPDRVGKAGEMDLYRDDLFDRYKKTEALIRRGLNLQV